MLSLKDIFEVSSALGDRELDAELRALLGFRAWDMCIMHEGVLGTDVQIFVIVGGDTAEVINDGVGFPLAGPDAEEPTFLSIEDHGFWWEMTLARDDDPHTRIFLERSPSLELSLGLICSAHFWPDDVEGGL